MQLLLNIRLANHVKNENITVIMRDTEIKNYV
jgi:hypothetical protein